LSVLRPRHSWATVIIGRHGSAPSPEWGTEPPPRRRDRPPRSSLFGLGGSGQISATLGNDVPLDDIRSGRGSASVAVSISISKRAMKADSELCGVSRGSTALSIRVEWIRQ
jgi:hypothetical protein